MDKPGGKSSGTLKKAQSLSTPPAGPNLFTFFNTLSKADDDMTAAEADNIDIAVYLSDAG